MTSRFASGEAVNVPTPIIRGLVSYEAWRVAFGATGDYDAVPDLDILLDGIEDGIDELAKAARDHVSTTRP